MILSTYRNPPYKNPTPKSSSPTSISPKRKRNDESNIPAEQTNAAVQQREGETPESSSPRMQVRQISLVDDLEHLRSTASSRVFEAVISR